MFSTTAACSNMFTFMAGATRTGARVASKSVESASSAIPCAILPRTLAVAGATRSSSAASARLMCVMSLSAPRANWSRNTGCRERASKVMGLTNCVAFRVITTWTSAPRFSSSRNTSQAL
jgi:hypothetical protein